MNETKERLQFLVEKNRKSGLSKQEITESSNLIKTVFNENNPDLSEAIDLLFTLHSE